ncbi:stalk domain-containing protein [Paenibacillus ferrarius]|uniref:stalk domain-containing protein n=1 Tax=Paenibacillus ferrarius TaxID=1469647 RepID=UPI003D2E0DF2
MKLSRMSKIGIAVAVMGTCFTAGVYAQDVLQRVDAYLRPDFKVVVGGQNIQLANPPLIYNNASYLPVKELGGYLNAVVNWQESTKTIYVNPRINENQPAQGNETNYTEIVLQSPYAYYMDYRGGTFPVLMNMTVDQNYYRLADVTRMGVDTSGLRKAKEKYTQELYVGESELNKVWGNQPPQPSYTIYEPIVISGETDAVKLKALRDYVESFRYYQINQTAYYSTPLIIDKLPEENTYSYLLNENNHYYKTTLKLTLLNTIGNNTPNYVVGSSSKEDIEVTPVNP